MSTTTAQETWLAAFGDPSQDLWGVALIGREPAMAVVRSQAETGPPVPLQPAQVGADAGEQWTLTTTDFAATISAPAGAVSGDAVASGAEASPLELCSLTGLEGGGAVRCTAVPGGEVASVRLVAAWFPAGRAIAMSAARPRRADGQDRDRVSVVARGEREGMSVFDPRLSTTYDGAGAPRRTGLELWLGESEEGEQYPRRLSGERLGGWARHESDGLVVEAFALRCHAHEQPGVGVYVLMRST